MLRMDARCNVRGEDSCSSTGSYNSYSTFPNDVDDSEVLSDDDNRSGGGGGRRNEKLVQESVSLENNAASTANLAYGRSSASHNSLSGSSPVSAKEDDEDSSMGDEDNNSCSDYSMDDCNITIVDDTSFKKPQNEAEIMFLQVVEILRYEKKVMLPHGIVACLRNTSTN